MFLSTPLQTDAAKWVLTEEWELKSFMAGASEVSTCQAENLARRRDLVGTHFTGLLGGQPGFPRLIRTAAPDDSLRPALPATVAARCGRIHR